MNDYTVFATILFRAFGVANIVFGVLYWPYYLLICYYSTPGTFFIVATLCALVYIALGVFLFVLSKRLAGIVLRGLDRD
jgi:hypothetical protein